MSAGSLLETLGDLELNPAHPGPLEGALLGGRLRKVEKFHSWWERLKTGWFLENGGLWKLLWNS